MAVNEKFADVKLKFYNLLSLYFFESLPIKEMWQQLCVNGICVSENHVSVEPTVLIQD